MLNRIFSGLCKVDCGDFNMRGTSHLISWSSETGAQDETGTGAVADTAGAIS